MSGQTSGILERALQLSRELLEAAGRGETQAATYLDAQRLQLLKSARNTADPLDAHECMLLKEISLLNDQSIGCLEHHRRIKGRQLDMAAVGRRAMHAYSSTRPLR